jgi:predicted MFS family arabinose efflux permease
VPWQPGTGPDAALPRGWPTLFAAASGLSVANIYFAHPLLDAMASDLDVSPASIGGVVTLTQAGYALGLIFLVPLGDLLDRRRLVVAQALMSAAVLMAVGLAPNATTAFIAMVAMGVLAVVVQVLVAFAATLAAPDQRGRVIGTVQSGVVIGILLARFVAGALADLGGWRTVYLVSAALTLAMAVILARVLPRRSPRETATSYPELLRSLFKLFRDEPVLRARATLALLIFAAINVLWASLALPLGAAPFLLSHMQIGLFGLAGLAGALGAGRAGLLADCGLQRPVTGLALGLMLLSWGPIALMDRSLLALALGVVLLDFAVQAVHVTNQSLILALQPEARSRLVGGYMVFYSVGCGAGAIASTASYAAFGWLGVCALGAGISLVALIFWALTATNPEGALNPSRRVSSPERLAHSPRSGGED